MQLTKDQEIIITQGIEIIESLYKRENLLVSNPQAVKAFCQLQIGMLEHEVFGVLFLDSQLRLISFEKMFRGSVGSASVYPREVAKAALKANASSVIFTHNHPSGHPEPSHSDKVITERLVEVLKMFDISVLDHIIIGNKKHVSFAEIGLL